MAGLSAPRRGAFSPPARRQLRRPRIAALALDLPVPPGGAEGIEFTPLADTLLRGRHVENAVADPSGDGRKDLVELLAPLLEVMTRERLSLELALPRGE